MATEKGKNQLGTGPKVSSQKNKLLDKRKGQIRSKKFRGKDVKLGLMDIDTVIVEYFENAIKPEVIDSSGQRIQVPIMYGNPERWASIQKSRVYRDEKGKLQLPLIMFKRNSIEKNRGLANKIDASSPKLYQGFENGYSTLNAYDNFNILQGMKRKMHYKRVVVPDYINLSYDFIISTEFLEQMNGIVESINYAEGTYWGRKGSWNFKSKIDSFENTVESSEGADRTVATTFSMTLSGYLIPDILQKKLQAESTNVITSYNVQVGENVVSSLEEDNTEFPNKLNK